MAKTTKSKVNKDKPSGPHKQYTYNEDQIILENWWKPKNERKKLLSVLNRPSDGAVYFRYSQLLKQMGVTVSEYRERKAKDWISNTSTAEATQEETAASGEGVSFAQWRNQQLELEKHKQEGLQLEPVEETEKRLEKDLRLMDLEQRIEAIEECRKNDKERFENWLNGICYLYSSGFEPKDILLISRENQQLKSENADLKDRYNTINNKLKRAINETLDIQEQYQKIYKEMDYWLGQFLRMGSMEKVSSLEDFIPRIKTVVDKFGNVVKITKEETNLLHDET